MVPAVLWERERGKIKNYWKIIKKHYLNEIVKKNINFDIGCIVEWCVICYKIGFWDAKCYIFWHVWWECSKRLKDGTNALI